MYVPVCLKRDVIVGLANEWMPMSVSTSLQFHSSTPKFVVSKKSIYTTEMKYTEYKAIFNS